jgi:hypothetical protein
MACMSAGTEDDLVRRGVEWGLRCCGRGLVLDGVRDRRGVKIVSVLNVRLH